MISRPWIDWALPRTGALASLGTTSKPWIDSALLILMAASAETTGSLRQLVFVCWTHIAPSQLVIPPSETMMLPTACWMYAKLLTGVLPVVPAATVTSWIFSTILWRRGIHAARVVVLLASVTTSLAPTVYWMNVKQLMLIVYRNYEKQLAMIAYWIYARQLALSVTGSLVPT
jgi:hypothetical protein